MQTPAGRSMLGKCEDHQGQGSQYIVSKWGKVEGDKAGHCRDLLAICDQLAFCWGEMRSHSLEGCGQRNDIIIVLSRVFSFPLVRKQVPSS